MAGWGSDAYVVQSKGLALGWLWSIYNLEMIAVALLILLDVPRPDPNVWLDLRRVVKLSPRLFPADLAANQDNHPSDVSTAPLTAKTWWGITTQMSEAGVEAALTQEATPAFPLAVGMAVDITIAEEAIALEGIITAVGREGEFPQIRLQFGPMPPATYRALVTTLFCRPGQWKRWNSPGELKSLKLLLQVLFWPRWLSRRGPRAVPVVKG
jgi:cellulose synthase (UDP-forming)